MNTATIIRIIRIIMAHTTPIITMVISVKDNRYVGET